MYPDAASTAVLTAQALCDTDFLSQASSSAPSCSLPLVASYPRTTAVTVKPLPAGLVTMPDPCAGVPVNPWCPAAKNAAAVPVAAVRGGSLAGTGLDARLPIVALGLLLAAGLLLRRLRRSVSV